VEYGGHWTLSKTASAVPSRPGGSEVEYLGERYHHFQTANAEITCVIGEFPAQVRAGDKADVEDYVNPPLILSCERSEHESTFDPDLAGTSAWAGVHYYAAREPDPAYGDVVLTWPEGNGWLTHRLAEPVADPTSRARSGGWT
jgi:hypothetical protein